MDIERIVNNAINMQTNKCGDRKCPRCGSSTISWRRHKSGETRVSQHNGGSSHGNMVGLGTSVYRSTGGSTLKIDYITEGLCKKCGHTWNQTEIERISKAVGAKMLEEERRNKEFEDAYNRCEGPRFDRRV